MIKVQKNFLTLIYLTMLFIFSGAAFALETQQLDDTVDKKSIPAKFSLVDNQTSKYFGANLFTGSFKDQPFKGFNPDYLISQGDKINLQLWGAFTYAGMLDVDAKGNIFVPEVGPINLLGVANKDLNSFVFDRVKTVFKKNVQVYANLEVAQPVKVFVTGEVNRPGLYHGYSSDSVLYYLDSASGIKLDSGSFIDVKVKRSGEEIAQINLYDFLLNGGMTPIQLQNGDAILVGKKRQTVTVQGEVDVQGVVEFDQSLTFDRLMNITKPSVNANYARITEIENGFQVSDYRELSNLSGYQIKDGAVVEFVKDNEIKTIAVSVSGENKGPAEYILPYGAKLSDLTSQLQLMDTADEASIQLLRKSVAKRQKVALERSLDALQTEVMIQPHISSKKCAKALHDCKWQVWFRILLRKPAKLNREARLFWLIAIRRVKCCWKTAIPWLFRV